MKHLNFLLFLLCLLGIKPLVAQEDSIDILWRSSRNVLSAIDKSQVTTGMLAEYGWHPLDLNHYQGNGDTAVTLAAWEVLYGQAQYMYIDSAHVALPFDSIKKRALSYIDQGINPIVIMDYAYNAFIDSAWAWHLFDTLNNKLIDVPNRWTSPYEKRTLFAACPWYFSMGSSKLVKLRIPSELYFGSDPTHMNHLELKVGSSWMVVQPDVTYTFDLTDPSFLAVSTGILFEIRYTQTEGELRDPVNIFNSFFVDMVHSMDNMSSKSHW